MTDLVSRPERTRRMGLLSLLSTALLAIALLLPTTAMADGELELSVGGATTGTMPDGLTLHFVIDAPANARTIATYVEDENYNYLGGCGGASCSVTILEGVLNGGSHPVTTALHIRAGSWPNYTSNWVHLQATVAPPDWKVSLSLPEEATMPDPVPVGIDITPKLWAPTRADLFDADSGQYAGFFCAPADGSCQGTLGTGWSPTPITRTYRAEMKDGPTLMGSDEKTVTIFPPSIGLTVSVPSQVLPGQTYTVSVTNSYNRYTPWLIVIRDDQGHDVGYCHTDDATCAITATAGPEGTSQSFSADLSWAGATVSSTSSAAINAATPSTMTSGPGFGDSRVDIDVLAAMFGSAAAVCNALLHFPGTHNAGSSTSDQWLECDAASQSGGTAATAIRAAVGTLVGVAGALGGQSLLDWLQDYAWINYGDNGPPAHPADPPVDPPATAPGPGATPQAVAGRIEAVTDSLMARNATLTRSEAEELAKQCLYRLGRAKLAGGELCETLPIFAPGADYPEATQHRIDAISNWPVWVRLQRRVGKRSEWYRSQPECAGSTTEVHCDEFPENRTYEGGNPMVGPGAPKRRPSLKLIDGLDNTNLGGQLGLFLSGCGLTDGQAFLVVPTPVVLGIPTLRLCNRP